MIDIKGTLKADIQLPLHCWDIYAMHLEKVNSINKDLEVLGTFQEKYEWKINLPKLLEKPYEALVLTNPNINIQWINPGFTTMTGYSEADMKGKSPRVLQGKNTTPDSKALIRNKLKLRKPFTAEIVNYRKNGKEYICRVSIYPIFNHRDELTHLLALEEEVYGR